MISEHTRNPGKRNRTGKARPCHPFLKKNACSKAGGCAAIRFIPTLCIKYVSSFQRAQTALISSAFGDKYHLSE